MIAEKMRYYKGSAESRERVELDEIRKDRTYITTCVVDVELLCSGGSIFPCGNGDDLKLDLKAQLKILEFVQEERKKLIKDIALKTMDGWHNSGLPTFEDYFKPGDVVSGDVVDYFLNNVPPLMTCSYCTQAGEAYSSETDPYTGAKRNTYATFSHLQDHKWRFAGYCFKGTTINRSTYPTRIESRIANLRRMSGCLD